MKKEILEKVENINSNLKKYTESWFKISNLEDIKDLYYTYNANVTVTVKEDENENKMSLKDFEDAYIKGIVPEELDIRIW